MKVLENELTSFSVNQGPFLPNVDSSLVSFCLVSVMDSVRPVQ